RPEEGDLVEERLALLLAFPPAGVRLSEQGTGFRRRLVASFCPHDCFVASVARQPGPAERRSGRRDNSACEDRRPASPRTGNGLAWGAGDRPDRAGGLGVALRMGRPRDLSVVPGEREGERLR